MKYNKCTEAIISLHHTGEIHRPFGRYIIIHNRVEVGSLSLPLYPAMFGTIKITHSGGKVIEQEAAILLASIQTKPYFKMSIDKRYMAIEKGTPIS